MTVRLYRNPVIRIPSTGEWLFQAESFATEYVQIKKSDPEQQRRIHRWAESWWLCTRAFVWYFEGEFERLHDRALKSGWTPSEILHIGKHTYHLTTSQVHEKWNFGPTSTGAVPKGLLPRSKASIFVMSCLVVPDVDIIGWVTREELLRSSEGKRHIIRESAAHPMRKAPGLARRDKRGWYV